MNENVKLFKIEFYLQFFWIFLALVGLSCNTVYVFYGVVSAVVPFPVSLILNFIILGRYPLIAIFNIFFSITEIVFLVSLIKVLFKNEVKKIKMICNIFFHALMIIYGFTCLTINDENSLTVIWSLILIFGIAIAIYSNTINIKFRDKDEKITIENAWDE